MKFTRTILLLLIFVFASACNSTVPIPTSSPTNEPSPIVEVTATAPSPTPTEISTLIVPTAEIPLPEGPISELQKTLGDKYKLTQEGDYFVIKGIEDLKFSKDGNWTRTYKLPNIEKDFVAKGNLSDIKINQDKLGIQDWEIVEGIWQRKTAEFATEVAGKTVELPLESIDEVQFEILNSSSANPNDRIISNFEKIKKLANQLFGRKDQNGGTVYYIYDGMYEENYTNFIWGDNMILVPDTNTNELKPKDTAIFAVVALGKTGRYGLVGWIDANGVKQVRVVDKTGLNKPSNFNEWYATHKH